MCFKCPDCIFIISGCKNNGWWLFYQFQHFKTVDPGHLDIEKDNIRLILRDRFQAFKSIITFADDCYLRIILQVFFYDSPGKWFIINQYRFHVAAVEFLQWW